MSMMDFYDGKSAEIALEEVLAARQEFLNSVKEMDTMAFILRYYIKTGEFLDPSVYGLPEPKEDDDE